MANVRAESKPKREVGNYNHGKINRASSIKTVYVQDNDFWDKAKDFAEEKGISLSEMIMQSLAEFMDKKACGKCARIAEILSAEILSAGSVKVKR